MGHSSVKVHCVDTKFRVTIIEADGSVSEMDFEIPENARAWANGQRSRLGIPMDETTVAERPPTSNETFGSEVNGMDIRGACAVVPAIHSSFLQPLK